MSDARRRELERDVARGDAGARAALLSERLRAGALSRERLLLAALLGDAAAREAVAAPEPPQDDAAWFRAVGAFSEAVAIRAVLVAAGLATAFRAALAGADAKLEHGVAAGCGWAVAACRASHLLEADEQARLIAAQQLAFAERYGAGGGVRLQTRPNSRCDCVFVGVSGIDAPLVLERLGDDPLAVPLFGDVQGLTAARAREEVARGLLAWALA